MKKVAFTFLFLISGLVNANVDIFQPNTILSFQNNNGRQIQVEFLFKKPLKPGESFLIKIANQKAILVTNKTNTSLERFSTRFRANKGDRLDLEVNYKDGVYKENKSLNVAVDYSSFGKDEYSLQPRISIANEQTKPYNSQIGDCLYLLSGISNTGGQVPEIIYLLSHGGEFVIESSPKLSNSPFFIIGGDIKATNCQVKVTP